MTQYPTQKDEKENIKKLQTSELRYRRLFEAAQDGILILDAGTGMIEDVNPFLIKMLGYSREEFIEKKLWEVGAFRDVEASQQAFEDLQEHEYIRYEDLPLKAKDGHLIEVEFVSNVYLVDDEKVIQCNIRDITERIHAQDDLLKSESRLRELSVRDHLTGLFNRRYMEESLERELLRASRNQIPLCIIMLDVDGFKQFNDTYGHVAGDMVLRELGDILRKHVRGEDIPTRYGGDEFIVILPGASHEATQERAKTLCLAASEFHLQIEGKTLEALTLSLGVAVFPQDGSSSTELLKAADTELYRAKRERREQVAAASQTKRPGATWPTRRVQPHED
jgi:diguanylate cyclase (GGDEF)-like protein/PAS domain S-box-containing protein